MRDKNWADSQKNKMLVEKLLEGKVGILLESGYC